MTTNTTTDGCGFSEADFNECAWNGAPIDWKYWVQQMHVLTIAQAAWLTSGLDPQRIKHLDTTSPAYQRAQHFQQLAEANGMGSASPQDWLHWANSLDLAIHENFGIEVAKLPKTLTKPVENVEAGIRWTPELKQKARAMIEDLKAKHDKAFFAKTAKEFNVTPTRLREVMKEKTTKETKPQCGFRVSSVFHLR